MAKGKLFLISACSGAGKTSLVTQLIADVGASCQLERVITYTTKGPRTCEVPGVDYHFLAHEEFEQKLADGFFLEWSDAYGAYYGSPRHSVEEVESGKGSRVLIIDRVGAEKVLSVAPLAVSIWLYTSNFEELKNRLISRGADPVDKMEARMQQAKWEIEREIKYPLYNYHILNDNFEVALKELKHIIQLELDDVAQL
jgi:guanylate kinase